MHALYPTPQDWALGPSASTATSSMDSTTTVATATTVASTDTNGTAADSTSGGSPDIVGCDGNVYELPAGCEHMDLDDAAGYADASLPSGFVACGDQLDAIYRVARVACAYEHHHPPCAVGGAEDCGSEGACQPGESCVDYYSTGSCTCLAQCNQDSDCQTGQICLCAGGIPKQDGRLSWNDINRCVPADCADDCECPDGLRCKVSDDLCGAPEALFCTTPADDCQTSSDCSGDDYCHYDPVEELWTCDSLAVCE
jgi:hypothetical protein